MYTSLINFAYLVAATLFILGLKGLAHPRTAVRGNLIGALGMFIAVVATLLDQHIVTFEIILAGVVVGSLVGAVLALKIRMTAMPQLVALFNGFGGGASVLVAGGALMGIGGAFLTLAHQNMFLIDVIGGRGWVAIAMVIFGNWDPLKGTFGALIFGFLDALQLRLQGLGIAVSFHLFLMIPYLLTIVALISVSRKASIPAGLLKPYRREEKGG